MPNPLRHPNGYLIYIGIAVVVVAAVQFGRAAMALFGIYAALGSKRTKGHFCGNGR